MFQVTIRTLIAFLGFISGACKPLVEVDPVAVEAGDGSDRLWCMLCGLVVEEATDEDCE